MVSCQGGCASLPRIKSFSELFCLKPERDLCIFRMYLFLKLQVSFIHITSASTHPCMLVHSVNRALMLSRARVLHVNGMCMYRRAHSCVHIAVF
jgi:hypothetical protein